MIQQLFDLKTLITVGTIAVGLGLNYAAVTYKIDNLEKMAPLHITRSEFALQQALLELRISTTKEEVRKISQKIDAIYERYGWKK